MNIRLMIFLINEIHLPRYINRDYMTDKLTSIYRSRFPDIEFECKYASYPSPETGRLTGWGGDEEIFTIGQYALTYEGERISPLASIELLINTKFLPTWMEFHKDRKTLNSKLTKMCKHIFCESYDPNPKRLEVEVTYTEWNGPEACHLLAYKNDQQAFYINNVNIDLELRQTAETIPGLVLRRS